MFNLRVNERYELRFFAPLRMTLGRMVVLKSFDDHSELFASVILSNAKDLVLFRVGSAKSFRTDSVKE